MKITDRLDVLVQARKPDIDIRRIKRDIADACGLSYEAVRRWYSGNTENLRNDNLIAIARKYDTTIDWLLTGTGAPPRRDSASVNIQTWITTAQARFSKLETPITVDAIQAVLEELKGATSQQTDAVGCKEISVPYYNFDQSPSSAPRPVDYSETISSLTLNEAFLQERAAAYSNAEQLAIVILWDNSMAGTLNDRDAVIVDCGVSTFNGDGLYLINWAGHLFIRRLQLAGQDQLELIADNPTHNPRTVPMADVEVRGRVLVGFAIRKF
ncbi:phage repressor protein C with HTH and peptisase S24 domain [Pseudomonas alcaligenes]|nr:phage repressor protein C with HTH and peptisase S24 domain [Pseudomonas alcaligenes]